MNHDACLSDGELLRYHRQINLKGWDLEGQERLKRAHVLIVGLGGLGCAASQYLATSGVGRLTLLDGDRVEPSNLARQVLHSEASLGQYKVVSAARRLADLNPYLQLQALSEFADELNLPDLLHDVDVVLDCTDRRASRELISWCCRAAGVPLVSAAVIRFEGQVVSFSWQPDEPCYRCLSRRFTEPDGSCVTNGVAGPLVGMVGSLQALQVVKWLSGAAAVPGGQLLLIDGRTLEFMTLTLQPDALCSVCGQRHRLSA
ncbi:MAG: HesA/MoeB/ThiF family protein [Aeromonadaceae bacterium]